MLRRTKHDKDSQSFRGIGWASGISLIIIRSWIRAFYALPDRAVTETRLPRGGPGSLRLLRAV